MYPVRCRRCGACHNKDGYIIHPPMHPVSYRGRISPWQLPEHRPIEPGPYEVRFRDTEPTLWRLHWDGDDFLNSQQRVVDCSTLLTWRGIWGDSV